LVTTYACIACRISSAAATPEIILPKLLEGFNSMTRGSKPLKYLVAREDSNLQPSGYGLKLIAGRPTNTLRIGLQDCDPIETTPPPDPDG
jgi:hypothetical protein